MFWYLIGAVAFLIWLRIIVNGIACNRVVPGVADLPLPGEEEALPLLSIIVAARNEEKQIRAAVESLLAQDHLNLELIVVDDRSTDSTPVILADLLETNPGRLKVQRIDELPEGWLGKCNALSVGAQAAEGTHLLFADADVVFDPSVMRRTHWYMIRENADQLAVLPQIISESFREEILFNVFGVCFILVFPPNLAMKRNSGKFFGVGAFNMVRTEMYRRIHGHKFLRLLVIDDMGLGRLIKKSGGVVRVAFGGNDVRIRWYESVGSIIRGLEKNSFAGMGFSVVRMVVAVLGLLFFYWWPIIGLFTGPAGARVLAGVTLIMQLATQAASAKRNRFNLANAMTGPMGAVLLSYAMLRSMVITLRQKGIYWRDSFYPLSELRKFKF